MSEVLLISGFHRSATSLTAQWLHHAGVSMGSQLVPPHASNPDGHFEDLPVVRMHDRWLQRHRTDWLFHDECALAPDARLQGAIAAYVGARDAASNGTAWGIKDPRLILALPAWKASLGDRLRLIVLARHWAECLQSLAIRHARELAWHLLPASHQQTHLRPWLDAEACARAWLATARRSIEAASSQPECAQVFTARGVAACPALPIALPAAGERLDVGEDSKPELKASMLHASVDFRMLAPISRPLREELDAAWDRLLELARLRAPDEALVTASRSSLGRHTAAQLIAACSAQLKASTTLSGTAALAQTTAQVLLKRVHEALAAKRPGLARVALGEHASAADCAAARLEAEAEILLAEGVSEADQAIALLDQAAIAASKPEALRLSLRICRLLLDEARGPEALERLRRLGTGTDASTPVQAWALLARALELTDGESARDAFLAALPEDALTVQFARAQALLPRDYAAGNAALADCVRTAQAGRPLLPWLTALWRVLPNDAAFEALLHSLWTPWRDAFGEDALRARLGLASLPAWRACLPDLPALLLIVDEPADGHALSRCLEADGWLTLDALSLAENPQELQSRDQWTEVLCAALPAACPDQPPKGLLLRGDRCLERAGALLSLSPALRLLHLQRHGLEAALAPSPHEPEVVRLRLQTEAQTTERPAVQLQAWLSTRLCIQGLAAVHADRVMQWRVERIANGETEAVHAWRALSGTTAVPFSLSHRHHRAARTTFPEPQLRLVEGFGYALNLPDQTTLPADFVPARYLKLNPDVASEGMDPVQHWVLHGHAEKRRWR